MIHTLIYKEKGEGDRHNDLEDLSTVQTSDFVRSNLIRKILLKTTRSNSFSVLFLQNRLFHYKQT